MLVFNGTDEHSGRWWPSRSKRATGHLWPRRGLDEDSYESDLVSAPLGTKRSGKMPAEVWFDSVQPDRFEVQEHSIRLAEGVYTLLHLTDEEMLVERMSAKRAWRNEE